MKKAVLLLVSVVLLACTCSAPALVGTPTQTSAPVPTDTLDTLPPVLDPSPSPQPSPTHQSKAEVTEVRLVPADGPLDAQLAIHAAAAAAMGQHMFVEFDASW